MSSFLYFRRAIRFVGSQAVSSGKKQAMIFYWLDSTWRVYQSGNSGRVQKRHSRWPRSALQIFPDIRTSGLFCFQVNFCVLLRRFHFHRRPVNPQQLFRVSCSDSGRMINTPCIIIDHRWNCLFLKVPILHSRLLKERLEDF